MNNTASLISNSRTEYQQLLAQHKTSLPVISASNIIGLLAISIVLLTIAGIGYYLGGHQFSFLEINSLSVYISPIFLHMLTMFGDGIFVLALILALTTRHIQFHWTVLLAAIIGGIATNVLKSYFDVSRPPAVLDHDTFIIVGKALTRHSFPSGHTLTGFLLAGVAICYVRSVYAKISLLILALGVGLSRILLGVHWPVDTLVGGALGFWSAAAAVWLSSKWRGGIHAGVHLFTLFLFVVACFSIFIEGIDYPHAKPMAYTVALVALIRCVYIYLIQPSIAHQPNACQGRLLESLAQKPGSVFLFFVLILLVYRIAVLTQGHFQVFYDEAYYYHWSLNPDFGYYSKPPMVAWFLSIGTFFFGPTTFGIKIVSPFVYAATSLIIFQLTRQFVSVRAALIAGVIFSCSLLVGFNSEFITTDAPFLFFWALSWYLFLVALTKRSLLFWVSLGVATGLGMLSKYTMGALPLALFAFMVLSNRYRAQLFTSGPWVAAVVAGVIFSLNIYWNIQHDFIALQHTKEISQTSGALVNFPSLLEFLATQFIIFGPVCSYFAIKALFNRKALAAESDTPSNEGIPRKELFKCAILVAGVILIAISTQAFLSRAFANWAAPWIIGASVLTAIYLDGLPTKAWMKTLRIGIYCQLVLLSLFYHWPQVLAFSQIEPGKTSTPFARVDGWKQLSDQLNPILQRYPSAHLLSESRDLLAYLGFYSMPGSFEFARWNPESDNVRDYYDLKVNLRGWTNSKNKEFIFVSKNLLDEKVLSRFEEHRFLGELYSKPYYDLERRAYVYLVTGFLGYSNE